MSRHVQYITEVRDANRQVWDGLNRLRALQREYNALDYGTTLPPQTEGAHAGIDALKLGAVVFDTTNAMTVVQDGGHATNQSKLL